MPHDVPASQETPRVHPMGQRVLQLLARPDEPSEESLDLCGQLFRATGDDLRSRWITCEIDGYGQSGAVAVNEALGVAEDAPLVGRVRGYRQLVGSVRTSAAPRRTGPLLVPHFFGEPVATLRHLRTNADAINVELLEVEVVTTGRLSSVGSLPSGPPARTLEFPRHVFHKLLAGLLVEAEMAVRAALQRFPR